MSPFKVGNVFFLGLATHLLHEENAIPSNYDLLSISEARQRALGARLEALRNLPDKPRLPEAADGVFPIPEGGCAVYDLAADALHAASAG